MEGDFRIEQWLVQPQLNTIVHPDSATSKLEPKVMGVLICLADHAGEVVSKEAIFQAVWRDTFVTDDALIRCIVELRKVFEDDVREPRVIQTIAKRGYRLIGEVKKLAEARSRYEIVRKLGQGGMAEVYLAKDRELRRNVALKFLPEEKQQDEGLRKGLIREARAAAALDHPFICKIYDVGEMDGKPYIAMEYLEGQTLKQKLEGGRLPMKEALKTVLEIAEALEVAHEHGIVHRDLKPANVMLTAQDHAKVLDFGLAKHVIPEGGVDSQDRTISELTRREVTVGTLSYMSPEQLRGEAVDSRSDIFSFGIVVHETVTGVHPFRKETGVETSSAILNDTPKPISQCLANTSVLLDHSVRKMLAKDAARRYQVIQDVRTDLQEVAEESAGAQASQAELQSPAKPPKTTFRSLPLRWAVTAIAATVVVSSAVWYAAWKTYWRPLPSQVTRSVLKVEPGHRLGGRRLRTQAGLDYPTRTAMAISSDGSFMTYGARPESTESQATPQIYLRRMDEIQANPVAGTEGGENPFLSPDNRWIGFWEEEKLKKVPVSGGVPVTLCDAAVLYGADWGPDNTIVFSYGEASRLCRVSGEGGKPEVLTVPDKVKEEFGHRLPHFIPGGRYVLFTVMGHAFDLRPRLDLLDLRSGKWRVLVEDAAHGRYVRTGHLVFLRQGTLMAVVFNLDQLEVHGQPVPVVAGVMQALNFTLAVLNTAAGQYSVSDAGSLAYVHGGILPDPEKTLVRVDRKGKTQSVTDFKAPFFAPRFSPDGQRIAYQTQGRDRQAWVYDLNSGTTSRLTSDGSVQWLAWTPDGKRLAFGWSRSAQPNLYWQPVDGSSPMERLTTSEHWQHIGSFSPDGAILAFAEGHPETKLDIMLLDMKSLHVTPFLNSKASEAYPEISPDGRWLAYASNELGDYEVWVRPFPGSGGRWKISKEGGMHPIWSKDGRQLFYLTADGVWVADIRTAEGFSAGKPRLLFAQAAYGLGVPIRGWDLYPDGQAFLMVKMEERKPQPVTELILVHNWFEEVKRLCPTGR